MSCPCSKLPQLVKVEDHNDLLKCLEKIEAGNWVSLFRCRECKQHWRVDDWDKLQIQFAVKISEAIHWQEFDDIPLHKQFLLESRGGLTEEKCIWQGCSNYQVKGVAYCIDHLFQTGARE